MSNALKIDPCTRGKDGASCGRCRNCWHMKNGTRLGIQIMTGRKIEYAEAPTERPKRRANPPGACKYLGKRSRDEAGKATTRYCQPCGKDLEVFTCTHHGDAKRTKHPLPTLAECHVCEDYEGR